MTETDDQSAEQRSPRGRRCGRERRPRSIDERIAAADSPSIWVGDQVHLRGYEPEDAEFEAAYEENTIDQRRGWKAFPPRSSVARKAWNEEASAAKPEGDAVEFRLAIARREDNRIVGGINPHTVDLTTAPSSSGSPSARSTRATATRARRCSCCCATCSRSAGSRSAGPGARLQRAVHRAAPQARVRRGGQAAAQRVRRRGFHDTVLFGMTVEEFHELYPKLRPRL
jgi:hypothetical protein